MTKPLFRQAVVERLSSPDELDQLPYLTSPRSWLLLAALGGVLLAVGAWSLFGAVPVTVAGRGLLFSRTQTAQPAAVLYVPFEQGLRVQPGMAVQLTLLANQQGQTQAITGQVVGVGALPSTPEAMLERLGNAAYVQLLVDGGALIEVQIALDPAQQQGVISRPASGTAQADSAGLPIHGTVTLARQRPLSFIFPTN